MTSHRLLTQKLVLEDQGFVFPPQDFPEIVETRVPRFSSMSFLRSGKKESLKRKCNDYLHSYPEPKNHTIIFGDKDSEKRNYVLGSFLNYLQDLSEQDSLLNTKLSLFYADAKQTTNEKIPAEAAVGGKITSLETLDDVQIPRVLYNDKIEHFRRILINSPDKCVLVLPDLDKIIYDESKKSITSEGKRVLCNLEKIQNIKKDSLIVGTSEFIPQILYGDSHSDGLNRIHYRPVSVEEYLG